MSSLLGMRKIPEAAGEHRHNRESRAFHSACDASSANAAKTMQRSPVRLVQPHIPANRLVQHLGHPFDLYAPADLLRTPAGRQAGIYEGNYPQRRPDALRPSLQPLPHLHPWLPANPN